MTYNQIPGYCDFHNFYEQISFELPDNAVVAEIGVYLGHSVAYLASCAKAQGKVFAIHAVDTFEGSPEHRKVLGERNLFFEFAHNMKECDIEKYIIPHKGFSVDVADQFEDESLHFCFIDGAHDYENIKADIKKWLPKVKKNGILAGHDYCASWPGVIKAVDEEFPNATKIKSVWMIRK